MERTEAIKILKEFHDKSALFSMRTALETALPELAENEDGRIRKRIIQAIKIREKEMNEEWSDEIAWLEKQGKKEFTFKSIPRLLDMIEPTDRAKSYCQKFIDSLVKEGYTTDAKIVKEVLKWWNGEDVPMAVMDEQKPINKVQPKFKVGDWIVTDKNHIWLIDEDCSTTGYSYRLISQNGKVEVGDYNIVDEHARLWTIQDAKDGDVLVYGDNPEDHHVEIIMLFKSTRNKYSAFTHFHIYDDCCGVSDWCDCRENAHPATKEQRDLLFQKMHEVGYTFDFKKKEVKKLKFKVGDEIITENEEFLTITRIDEGGYWSNDLFICSFDDSAEWRLVEQKYHIIDEGKAEMDYCFTKMMNGEKVSSAWSEENDKAINDIMWIIEAYRKNGFNETHIQMADSSENWLKSLKQRCTWKPSKEQMDAMQMAVSYFGYSWASKEQKLLESLYKDLKKLKGGMILC